MESFKILLKHVLREGNTFRLRVQNFRIPISTPEVQIDWRELVEGILLTVVTLFLYRSVVLTQFTFVPFVILSIKRGWKETLFYLTGALFILIYFNVKGIVLFPLDEKLLLFSPIHYSFSFIAKSLHIGSGGILDFYFLYGGFGIFFGYLISKNYKFKYVIFVTILTWVGIVVGVFVVAGMISGFNTFMNEYTGFVDSTTKSYINQSLVQINSYRGILSSRGINYIAMGKKIAVAAELYKREIIFGIAPRGGYLIKQIITIFLGIIFVKIYFRKRLKRASLQFNVTNCTVADGWVWGLITSWAIVFINLYLKNTLIGIMGWNSAVIFSFLFFLRGISIVKIAADKLRVPQFLQYVLFIFLLFYSFIIFVTIITAIGVSDIWLELRSKLKKIDEGSNS